MSDPIDLDALEACHRAATPAPWHANGYDYWLGRPLRPEGVLNLCPMIDQPAIWISLRDRGAWVLADYKHEYLVRTESLPALCRWLRANLPRLRAEAGL